MSSWRARAVSALVLAVVANLLLALLTDREDPVVVTAMVVAAVATVGLVLDAVTAGAAATWTSQDPTGPAREQAADARLAAYHHLLERHRFGRVPDTALQHRLLDLADQRISQVYGVRLASDRPRALRLVGPELAALDTPRPLRLGPGEIDRLLDRIEAL